MNELTLLDIINSMIVRKYNTDLHLLEYYAEAVKQELDTLRAENERLKKIERAAMEVCLKAWLKGQESARLTDAISALAAALEKDDLSSA